MLKRKIYRLREKLFKYFFLAMDYSRKFISVVENLAKFTFSIFAVLFIGLFFYHIGFWGLDHDGFEVIPTYKIVFLILFSSKFIVEIVHLKKRRIVNWLINGLMFVFVLMVFYANYLTTTTVSSGMFANFTDQQSIIIASFVIILSEINVLFAAINSFQFPPSLIFVLSFLFIILIGSGLLMLPNALNEPISYLEALFTSTSAVCVTGLIVLDTATTFTTLGKIIILSLIQVGGLGIMTFTGFFSYVFTGGSSLRDRFVLKDILSTENLNNLFSVLIKIILITFAIELVGAVIIFLNVPDSTNDKLLFSIFHSISAFCNAGFSTLPQGLFTTEVVNNYQIQTTIAFLIIMGGIGFPVILWCFRYVERVFINSVFKIRHLKTSTLVKKDINTSIVLSSTLILTVVGMVLYYLFENESSLKGMGSLQKLMVTFFGSVSARTAGFNVTDISLWGYPTVFMMIFLMWVGASPGSTGGGIKTTTFVIALRTAFSFIRGKKTLEMRNREIGTGTLVRVMVVITLSIVVIFVGFMGLIISDPDKNPVHLLFETFSAFGTVGLSIVNTSTLTTNSKIIIILLMFIGRVGPLTLLTGLLVTNRTKKYKYAVADVVIN